MLLRLKYLKKDLENTKEKNVSIQAQFKLAFYRFVDTLPEQVRDYILETAREKVTKQESERRKRFKPHTKTEKQKRYLRKILKEIAKETHPDQTLHLQEVEAEAKTKLFKEAQAASDDGDFHKLSEIAETLKIELPQATEENLVFLKESISNMNQSIKKIKKTVAWVWYHSNTSKREKVMKNYVERVKKESSIRS